MSEFEDAANQLTNLIQGLNEALKPIQEAAEGYREEMKRRGFNEEATNQMATHYHEVLMVFMKNYAFGSKK